MDFQTLILNSLSMFRRRGSLHLVRTFTCYFVLSCIYCLAANGPWSLNRVQNSPDYDDCASFEKSYYFGSSETTVSDSSLGDGFPTTGNSFGNVCPNSHSFCFPSILSGFSRDEKIIKEASIGESGSQQNSPYCVELAQDSRQASNKSWSSDYGVFRLLTRGIVSCSLNSKDGVNEVPSIQTEIGNDNDISSCGGSLQKQKTVHSYSKSSESNLLDGSVSPSIRIGPTVLDWGQKHLYSSSAAFLTVANTCNESTLHLYEPFSTDLQFYPCNFSDVSLRPGESAIICFAFFPKYLGFSSASLILQTNSGGFVVDAKGYATESPFGIQPLSGMDISPGGRLSRNFSLFNPFDEPLYVEQITAWISISLGNNTVETEVTCGINDFQAFGTSPFPAIKDRLVVKSGQMGSPIVAIRPHRNWDINSNSSETLIEMDVTAGFEGKIFSAFCLHLLRSSQDTSDTIIVPIEAEVDSHSVHDTVGRFVSATLDGRAICDNSGEIAITISLRNDAPYVLSFVKFLEVAEMELFHIKYKEGLLLFPGTATQVGIIYCSHLHLDSPKVSYSRENCKLFILTNDSSSSVIEIPCEDILYICLEHQRLSSVGVEGKSKHIPSGNLRVRYGSRGMYLPPDVKVFEGAVDELVLENWKSHGTNSGMSVLEDQEVLFPIIQVGTYVSRWITVKNPSPYPVMMQLILNSGEITTWCSKGLHDLLHPSSSDNLVADGGVTPTKHGFSVPESALTEAYVQPYDRVTLGPINFYPSERCGWSGSVLVRNNLSGVEWIPLRGFGGLLSLDLLEGGMLVPRVDFDLQMPKPLNFSLPYSLLSLQDVTSACSQILVKELYVQNTGDLPLVVKSISVCGRECGSDGFKILHCRGFALEPGESMKLTISYQTDFSAAVVHRDLEFALETGTYLLPVKASFPYDMLSHCKKSLFWTRVKKSLFVFLLVVSLIYLTLWYISRQNSTLGSLDIQCNSDDKIVPTPTMKSAGKTSSVHHNKRKSKLSMSSNLNPPELGISQHLTQTSENHHVSDTPGQRALPSTAVKSPESSNQTNASQLGHLVVKTGKEKRRRKKRNGVGAKLPAMSEVSSSQSGNSTPSSPVSPTAASATTKCNWSLSSDVEQPFEARSSKTQVAPQHSVNNKVSAESNMSKPAFPRKCRSSNMSSPQVSYSASGFTTFTPHVQPPGSKLQNQKGVKAEEAAGLADEYRYDIWGDHLPLPHLLLSKNVTQMKSSPPENNFDSFFVKGPQTLLKKG